jgi:hypothetical protein
LERLAPALKRLLLPELLFKQEFSVWSSQRSRTPFLRLSAGFR